MNAQDDPIICLRCTHKNEPGALKCTWCGAPFTSETTTVKVSDLPKRSEGAPLPRLKPVGEGLSLFVAGEVRPLIVSVQEQVILGRHTKTERSPSVVDLTPYNAGLLGVSRKHAAISMSEGHYTLRDLNSTNGTWLNEKQVPSDTPFILRNGDQVRLAQLIISVYFSNVPAEVKVVLRDTAFPQDGAGTFTTGYVGQNVGSYLQAIISLQQVLDRLMARTVSTLAIESISVNARDALVSVTLSGGQDALLVIRDTIEPWKRTQAEMLAQLRTTGGGTLTPDQVSVLRDLLRPLALAIIQDHALAADEHFTNAYVERIFPHLQVLGLSTLELQFQE